MTLFCTEYVQQSKTSKVESNQASAPTPKTALLQQLVAAVSETGTSNASNEVFEEKVDNQAEGEKREEVDGLADPFLPQNRPQQKSKKKCWICKAKLELAQRELGSCKCGKVFGMYRHLAGRREITCRERIQNLSKRIQNLSIVVTFECSLSNSHN